jgi:hypothetical protein
MQQHDIARVHLPEQLVRIRGEDLRVVAGVGATQRLAADLAVNLVVQPLGNREELLVAAITIQRTAMSRPAMYPTSTCSISATPPPTAVELTFQTVRPPSLSRNRAAAVSSRAYRTVPMTGSSRATGIPGTETSCSRPNSGPRGPAGGRAKPLAEGDGRVLTSSATLRPPG